MAAVLEVKAVENSLDGVEVRSVARSEKTMGFYEKKGDSYQTFGGGTLPSSNIKKAMELCLRTQRCPSFHQGVDQAEQGNPDPTCRFCRIAQEEWLQHPPPVGLRLNSEHSCKDEKIGPSWGWQPKES